MAYSSPTQGSGGSLHRLSYKVPTFPSFGQPSENQKPADHEGRRERRTPRRAARLFGPQDTGVDARGPARKASISEGGRARRGPGRVVPGATPTPAQAPPHADTLRAARKGGGEATRTKRRKEGRVSPLPPGLSDDDSAGPSHTRASKWSHPYSRSGGQLRASLWKAAGQMKHISHLAKRAPSVCAVRSRAAPVTPQSAAFAQVERACSTRATRSPFRLYRSLPSASRSLSSAVQSWTPSTTIASTGATW